MMNFCVITGPTVSRLLREDRDGCLEVVKAAYLTHARGDAFNPSSVFLRFPDRPTARIIALPAHLNGGSPISGIKWVASYPDNIQQGLPRASAVIILNNAENGYPFACLEASVVSAARTAASAVLAAQPLMGGGRHADTLGIIGAGFIARHVYEFLLGSGWTIDRVRVYDRDPAESARFITQVCLPDRHRSVTTDEDLASTLGRSDLVLFATTAGVPHVADPHLLAHHPAILHLSLRDLDPALLLDAVNIVDDREHALQANTSLHLAEQLTGSRDFLTGTLAEVMTGQAAVDPNRTRVFSPFGMGILDVAVAHWIYDRALPTGEAIAIPDFFGTLMR